MTFTMILAESALELIPPELQGERSIVSYCRKIGRTPSRCLLDRSYHHRAMSKLPESHKRGRPDIAYHVMLDTVYSPLFMDGMMDFYIHTVVDKVIGFGRGVRPPREYSRYEGLMVDLLTKGKISSHGRELLSVRDSDIEGLLAGLKPKLVIGLSVMGEQSTIENIGRMCAAQPSGAAAVVIIGGFPHGHFSGDVQGTFDRMFSIAKGGLDASLVSARVIYEVEKALDMAGGTKVSYIGTTEDR